MELVKTIYPALATLIAAFLVFVYSFVNILVSKDQKTTEFRQNWIDSIREEIAQVVASAGFIASQAERFQNEENGNDKFHESCKSQFHEMSAHFHRIQLRLNPDGKIEKNILSKLLEIENALHSGDRTVESIAIMSDDLIKLAQSFLKKEWSLVKRGELGFIITKFSFLFAFIGILTFIIAIFTGYIDIAALTKYIKA